MTQVIATDAENIVRQARIISSWNSRITVKIPASMDGIKAITTLKSEGIRTTMTLVYSAAQAVVAALAGAEYVAPFLQLSNKRDHDGYQMVRDILQAYENGNFETQVLVASINSTYDIMQMVKMGAHAVTAPFEVIEEMISNSASVETAKSFFNDWDGSEI